LSQSISHSLHMNLSQHIGRGMLGFALALATIVVSLASGAMARSPGGLPDGIQDRRKH